jgi:hypothetical protein
MNDVDEKITRLLRSAGCTSEDVSEQAPFGFDTRVVALWRAEEEAASLSLARLIRRVALVAAAVTIVATAGAYRESNRNVEKSEPFANEFAIADSAIQDEFLQ